MHFRKINFIFYFIINFKVYGSELILGSLCIFSHLLLLFKYLLKKSLKTMKIKDSKYEKYLIFNLFLLKKKKFF